MEGSGFALEVAPVSSPESSTTTRYATVPTASRSCDAPLRLATRTATIPGARAGAAHVALALAAPPPSSSVSSTNLAAIPNTVPNAHASNACHPPRTPTTVPPETYATTGSDADSNRNPPRGARRASNSNAAFDRDDPAVRPPPRSSVPPSRRATSTRDTSPSAANVAASVAALGGPHVTSADDTHRAGSVDAGSELDDDAHQHHVPGSRGRFAPTTNTGLFANPSAAAATDGYSEYVIGSSRTSSCASGELANARARDHVALDAERPAGPIARA